MAMDLKREVVRQMQYEGSLEELQEYDMHEADEADKIDKGDGAKEGGLRGRPRKSSTEVLADAAKLLRDKVRSVDDHVSKLDATRDGLFAEITKNLGTTLPHDTAQVKVKFEEEYKALKDFIAEERTKLAAITPEGLVSDPQDDNSPLAKVKHQVAEISKKVLKDRIESTQHTAHRAHPLQWSQIARVVVVVFFVHALLGMFIVLS